MPISWLPLVADYNRFARPGAGGFAGTYWGYLAGNVWFYALGALLVLAAGAGADVFGIGTAIAASAGGAVVLIALLVGESDNAFADIYSAAVSTQNVLPDLPQRALTAAVGAVGFLLALAFSMERYELFLLLIGSVFVPSSAVFVADYFVLHRGRYGEGALFSPTGVNVRAAPAVGHRVPAVPLERPDRTAGVDRRDADALPRLAAPAVPAARFEARGEHPELRRGLRPVAGRPAANVAAGRPYSYTARRVGGGAATSRMTAGSSEAFLIVSSEPAGTRTVPHWPTRLRPLSTWTATRPATTVQIASESGSEMGPRPWAPWRHTISDHRWSDS